MKPTADDSYEDPVDVWWRNNGTRVQSWVRGLFTFAAFGKAVLFCLAFVSLFLIFLNVEFRWLGFRIINVELFGFMTVTAAVCFSALTRRD